MDVATLNYAVDTTSVAKGTQALDQHAQAGKGAAQSAQEFQNVQQKVPGKVNPATESLKGQRETFRTLAGAAGLVGGPLGGFISQTGLLTIGVQKINPALIATSLAIAAISAATYKAVAAYGALEAAQAGQKGLLNLTGGASGQSVEAIENTVQSLSKLGTQSVNDIRAAASALLTFRQIGASTFPQVLEAAVRLSDTGIMPLKAAVTTLGSAVADPLNKLDALEDAGIKLSAATITTVQNLAKQGQLMQAQAVLVGALTEAIGKNEEASNTLYGSWGKLENQNQLMIESWGRAITEGLGLKTAIDKIRGAMEAATNVDPNGILNWFKNVSARFSSSATFGFGPFGAPKPGDTPAAPPSTSTHGSGPGAVDTAVDENTIKQQMLRDKIKATTDAMQDQIKTAGMSEVAQDAYNRSVAAGVLINGKAAVEITNAVQQIAGAQYMKTLKDQFTQQTDALKTEAATFSMAAGKAAEYRFVQEAITQAKIKGVALGPQAIAQIQQEAAAVGVLTAQLEKLRNAKQAADAVSSALVDGLFDVATGAKSASAAIKDFTLGILKMMAQASLAGSGPFAGMFGTASSGGVFGTLLKGLFGGAGGSAPAAASGLAGAAGAGAVTLHGGGPVGGSRPSTHAVSPSIVPGLPRLHSGSGLSADERLAVLQTGEVVSSRSQVAAGRGSDKGPRTQVFVQNYTGEETKQETRQGPDGEDLIYVTIGKYFSTGKGDNAMSRYGVTPSRVAR